MLLHNIIIVFIVVIAVTIGSVRSCDILVIDSSRMHNKLRTYIGTCSTNYIMNLNSENREFCEYLKK